MMKKVFKRNQIVVFVIGLMLITAGYLNFANTKQNKTVESGAMLDAEEMASLGDARLVSSTNVVETNDVSTTVASENVLQSNEIKGNTLEKEDKETKEDKKDNSEKVNGLKVTDETNVEQYFTTSKLERETIYSQRIENYQEILNNVNVSETQKKLAQEEITKIGEEQNAIMIAENLIRAKGIEDLVIFINANNINVIIKGNEPKKEQIAQVQNIIMRELDAKIENIHIMNK